MRIFKLIISCFLVVAMSFSLVACGDKTPNPQPPQENNAPPIVGRYSTVWTTPATNKVMRTDKIAEDAKGVLAISAAKGESESGQIIITPDEVEVTEYSVTVNDLQSGTNTLSKDSIEVFVQHYIKTTARTNSTYGAGWYPDALIPYDYAKKANELKFNADAKKDNQGIWFTVNVPEGQAAGLYSGEIKLDVEGESFSIPIKVNVYDFALPKSVSAKAAFAIWEDRDMIESGYKIDGQKMTAAQKDEIVKAEYEYFISKKISPTNLPNSEYTKGNAKSFAAAAKKYALREEVSSFRIGIDAPNRVLNSSLFESYLQEMLDASIENGNVIVDIFSKSYCYFAEIDEPHPSTGGSDIYDRVKGVNDTFLACKQAIMNIMDTQKYAGVTGIDKLKESLQALPHIVTSERKGELLDRVQTFCPQVQFYNDRQYFDITEERKESKGEGAWWYTCLKPVNPYPSYHIDDTLVGARVMGWMQKEYKIEGNLYWSTNIYRKYNVSTSSYQDRDVWTDPLAFPGANGDGYLTYPGTRYGIQAPIGTIRLDTVRDAQEDYEYLTLLENLLETANKKYGTAVEAEAILRDCYDMLYSGSIAVNDYNLVYTAREKVANLIEALAKDVLVDVSTYRASTNDFKVTVYTYKTDVKINGKDAEKSGNAYSLVTTESMGTITVAGMQFKYNKGKDFKKIEDMEKVSWIGSDYTLETSNAQTIEGKTSLKATLSTISGVGATYTSKLVTTFGATDLSSSKYLVIYVYNDSDSVVKPTFSIIDEAGKNSRNEVVGHLYSKQWNKVSIRITQTKGMDLTKAAKVQMSIKPPASGTVILYLDNLYAFA